jgi:hypothetical protein
MALTKYKDAAGRDAWLDTSTNMVFTEGGGNPTFYNKQDWDARQIKKYGSGGTKSDSMADTKVNEIMKAITPSIKEQSSYLSKYVKKNPFVFDEALAEKSAKAEYEPYYTELLQDYIKGIDLSKQTIQTEKKLQAELQTYETGKRSREYTQAIAKAEEGFAGAGLFFSGIKNRALGEQDVEKQAGDEYLKAGYTAKAEGFSTQTQALDLQQQQKQRDLEREQEASIEGGILQRKEEAAKPYWSNVIMDYARKFPTSSGNSVLAGYVPSEYMRY